MRVKVRYFAILRDAAGVDSEEVETVASCAGELFTQVSERHPGMRREFASLVAINDEMAHWDTGINDGDEVLFFPPVAGG
jgi:MoaD family protein